MATTKCLITESDRESFQKRGVLCLRQLLPSQKVERACDAVQTRLADAGIWKDGGWRIDHLRNAKLNAGAKFARRIKGCTAVSELIDDEIPQVVATLLDGRPTFTGMNVPQPLCTLPNADSWCVPHDAWHLDVPRLPDCGIPGVQIFTFLHTVAPTGGGTLVVAGSHHLLNGDTRISSRDVKRELKTLPYFQALMSKATPDRHRFKDEVGRCGDVELQVVEMCGEPGDVYFVDLRTLHTPAPNATTTPRVMATRRFFLEELRHMIHGDSNASPY